MDAIIINRSFVPSPVQQDLPQHTVQVTKVTYANGVEHLALSADMSDRKATIHFSDGTQYEGPLVCGTMTGQGKLTWADGQIFEGWIENGVPHESGEYTFPNGATFTGEICHGKFHGDGMLQKGGSYFIGNFKEGKEPTGRGEDFNEETGVRYVGEYKEGRRSGQGSLTTGNGTSYKTISNDERSLVIFGGQPCHLSGTGHGWFSDGTEFTGAMTHGKPCGEVEMIFSDGSKLIGIFGPNGEMPTQGVIVSAQTIYKGAMMWSGHGFRMLPHGWGQLYNSAGTLYHSGEFEYGQLKGPLEGGCI